MCDKTVCVYVLWNLSCVYLFLYVYAMSYACACAFVYDRDLKRVRILNVSVSLRVHMVCLCISADTDRGLFILKLQKSPLTKTAFGWEKRMWKGSSKGVCVCL